MGWWKLTTTQLLFWEPYACLPGSTGIDYQYNVVEEEEAATRAELVVEKMWCNCLLALLVDGAIIKIENLQQEE